MVAREIGRRTRGALYAWGCWAVALFILLNSSSVRAEPVRNEEHHFLVIFPFSWQTMTDGELDKVPDRRAKGFVGGARSPEADGPVCLIQVLTKPEGDLAACLPDFQRVLEKSGAKVSASHFDALKSVLVAEVSYAANGAEAAGSAYAFVGRDEMVCLTFMAPPKGYYRDAGIIRSVADTFVFEQGYGYGSYRAFNITRGRILDVVAGVALSGFGVWYWKIRGRRPKGERGLGGRRML